MSVKIEFKERKKRKMFGELKDGAFFTLRDGSVLLKKTSEFKRLGGGTTQNCIAVAGDIFSYATQDEPVTEYDLHIEATEAE